MPYVRVVDQDPSLPHQVVISMSQNQRNYLVSCNCLVGESGHKKQLAEVPARELGDGDYSTIQFLLRVWREAHNPPLDDETVAEAHRHRWVWVQ